MWQGHGCKTDLTGSYVSTESVACVTWLIHMRTGAIGDIALVAVCCSVLQCVAVCCSHMRIGRFGDIALSDFSSVLSLLLSELFKIEEHYELGSFIRVA